MENNQKIKQILMDKTCSNCNHRYFEAKNSECYTKTVDTCEHWLEMDTQALILKGMNLEIEEVIEFSIKEEFEIK